jgi:membrane-associated phospholipid phosphatase
MRFDFDRTSREVFSVLLRDVSAYGGIGFYVVAIALFFVMSEFMFASRLVASLLAVTAIVGLTRLAYFKPRPGMKKKSYGTYYERIDNSSFPSIHAARAALISAALFTKLSLLLPLLIVVTFLVCVGRIYFKRHDFIDITAGTALGLALGFLFFYL